MSETPFDLGEELRESRHRLRLAANAAQLGWYSYDFVTDEVVWSQELKTLVDLAPGEAVTITSIHDRLHPEDRQRFLLHSDASSQKEGDAEYRGEFRFLQKGRVMWLEDRGTVIWGGSAEKSPPHSGHQPLYAVGMVTDITDRKNAEFELRQLNQSLEDQVAERTAILVILQDITRVANEAQTIEEAIATALDRINSYDGWKIGHVWQAVEHDAGTNRPTTMESTGVWHVDETFKHHDELLDHLKTIASKKRIAVGDGLIGKVMRTGRAEWVEDVEGGSHHLELDHTPLRSAIAFPITIQGEVVAVMEFLSDKNTHPTKELLRIVPDVGIQLGHLIERKRLERVVAEIAIAEQQRIGRELHDGIAQQLTGGALIAAALKRRMTDRPADSIDDGSMIDVVQQLIEIINQAHHAVRHLSSGLMLSVVHSNELLPMLRAIAATTSDRFQIQCDVDADGFDAIALKDDRVALAMVQIAREATHNAVKHSGANRLTIRLTCQPRLAMSIGDDGDGFDGDGFDGDGGPHDGRLINSHHGLRIMRHRAGAVGGRLDIQTRRGGGTTVNFVL